DANVPSAGANADRADPKVSPKIANTCPSPSARMPRAGANDAAAPTSAENTAPMPSRKPSDVASICTNAPMTSPTGPEIAPNADPNIGIRDANVPSDATSPPIAGPATPDS